MLLKFYVCRFFAKGGPLLSSAYPKFHSARLCNQIYKRKFIYKYILQEVR